MYRAYNPNADYHFFTTSQAEFDNAVSAGYTDETTANGFPFYVSDTQLAGTAPIYRLYNPNNGRHYYTTSEGEKNYLVGIGWLWQSNKIEGYIYTSAVAGSVEIFKLYNNNSGTHLYTVDLTEKDTILAVFPGIWVINTSLGYAFTPSIIWTKQLGTSSTDEGFGIAVDSAGNSYVTGQTWGSLGNTSAGSYDIFVMKYDTNGTK